MEAYAYSPSHITGIFQILDHHPNPLYRGSRGGGLCIRLGVHTRVRARPSCKPESIIFINGIKSPAPVSRCVLGIYESILGRRFSFIVEHETSVPMGSGFGVSGAGALSLSLALNELLNLGLSKMEAAQLAHIAEVKCKTGLGTVIAETVGGVELRVREGAPKIGKVKGMEPNGRCSLVALYLGPLSTKLMLSNKSVRRKIDKTAEELMALLIREPSVENLLRCSSKFSERTGLMTSRAKAALKLLQKRGWQGAMAMFGEVIFTLVRHNEVGEVEALLQSFEDGRVLISDVEPEGARVLC